MTDKRFKIQQGGYTFEICCRDSRHDWIIAELARQWRAFAAGDGSANVAVLIDCYDPDRPYSWQPDRLEPFHHHFRKMSARYPFDNPGLDATHHPEKILARLDPDRRTIKKMSNRLSQSEEIALVSTDTGLLFFDPGEKTLFVFTPEGRAPIPLLTRLYSRPSVKRSLLVADILNGVMLALAWLLIQDGGLLLHGAGVQKYGQTVLFLGRSGAGKSTVTRSCAPDACFSDDGVVIKKIDNDAYIYPSLFTQARGYWRSPLPDAARLAALFWLDKSDRDRVKPLDKNFLMDYILLHLIHFFRYFSDRTAAKAFENVSKLVGEIPAYRLAFTLNRKGWQDVWQTAGAKKNTSRRS